LYDALAKLGFGMRIKPQGAFYIYADCSEFCEDSFEFVSKVLQEKHVAFTPGIDFGKQGAKQHVRFAYTTNLENLKIGIERLAKLKS